MTLFGNDDLNDCIPRRPYHTPHTTQPVMKPSTSLEASDYAMRAAMSLFPLLFSAPEPHGDGI